LGDGVGGGEVCEKMAMVPRVVGEADDGGRDRNEYLNSKAGRAEVGDE
jgi:hypothetical protein